MKKPFIALVGVAILSISIPVVISLVSYDDSNHVFEKESGGYLSIIRNKDKDNKVKDYDTVDKESPNIKVYNHKTGKTMDMDIEKYLQGVLAGEMPANFDSEALKAQAVAARTYTLYKQEQENPKEHPDAVVCTDFNHCQEYKSYEELKEANGEKWIKNLYPKIKKAVSDTKGQIVTYKGKPILPLYFSTSSGKTENSEEVFANAYPYLRSVESKYDDISPKFESDLEVSFEDFASKIKGSYSDAQIDISKLKDQVKITKRSNGGAVENIKIGNKTITGRDVRSIFTLNSANFDLMFEDNKVKFDVKGYGHGVGMSQWGAEGMAQDGYKYYDILLHYYTKSDITDIY